jgi:hypothetical protein
MAGNMPTLCKLPSYLEPSSFLSRNVGEQGSDSADLGLYNVLHNTRLSYRNSRILPWCENFTAIG